MTQVSFYVESLTCHDCVGLSCHYTVQWDRIPGSEARARRRLNGLRKSIGHCRRNGGVKPEKRLGE